MKITCYDDVFRAYINPTLISLFSTEKTREMDLAFMLASPVERKMLIHLYHTDLHSRDRVEPHTVIDTATKRLSDSEEDKRWMNVHFSGTIGKDERILWKYILKDLASGYLPYNDEVYHFLKAKLGL